MDENKDSLALFSSMYVIFLAFAYYFLRLYFCQYFFFFLKKPVYFTSRFLTSFKNRGVSSTGPGLPHTAAWQSRGAATPARGARPPAVPLWPLTGSSLRSLRGCSLAHPFRCLQTLLWLSVRSHQWGAPAGGVQAREGSAKVVICLADSLVTLDWLCLTFSLFLHSRKILLAPGPLCLLLPVSGMLLPWLFPHLPSSSYLSVNSGATDRAGEDGGREGKV